MIQQPTVVVVDDDPSMLLICEKTLEAEGFRVLTASGSSEALRLCAEQLGSIQLLLTDLLLPPPDFQMATAQNKFPRVHGHELLARVVEMKRAIHVVCMSSSSAEQLAAHGIQLDGVPFLQKPFTVEQLLQIVRHTLAGPPLKWKEPALVEAKQKDIRWYG